MKKFLVMITMFLSFTTAFAQGICGANVLINFDASLSILIHNREESLSFPSKSDANELHPRIIPLDSYLNTVSRVRSTLNMHGARDPQGNFSHQLGAAVMPNEELPFEEKKSQFVSQWIYKPTQTLDTPINFYNLRSNFKPYVPNWRSFQKNLLFEYSHFMLTLYQNINSLVAIQTSRHQRQKNIIVFISDFESALADPFPSEIRNFSSSYLYQNSQLGKTELILIQARNPESLDQSRMEDLAAQLKIPEQNIFMVPPKPQAKFIWSKGAYDDLIDSFLSRLKVILPACA